ncbi:MAG: SGNH/GDSL hydrolase family protein [Exiguobacterium oxidotolerans]|uniref:GDSL family lipase n=1 Tax=Exiguobacterium oxidotolerans TaxID=223958 RepID=A0A653I7N7_9BACL|nr:MULTISPECIES: SGNH/GDSL hydrolase family protein [Exiguobacterium]VWX35116.1 GDSL family lipase [Exiguobacterium oxidotolerans]
MKKALLILSVVINIVLLALLFGRKPLDLIEDVFPAMSSKPVTTFQYTKNSNYVRLNSLFHTYQYPKSPNAVMLGDSMTHFGDWRILMNDSSIVNFGIPGDTTEGFLTRLDLILELEPKQVFVMGGINDIRHFTPVSKITENMTTIVTTLRKNNIDVVIQSTVPVAPKYSDSVRVNREVEALNRNLKQLAESVDADFVDLRPVLTNDQGYLQNRLTYDGLHLVGGGYLRWSDALKPYAEKIDVTENK